MDISTLFRTTPDPSAPNSLPYLVWVVWQAGVFAAVAASLPTYILTYCLTSTTYPSLKAYVFFRVVRTMGALNPYLPPAASTKETWSVPRFIIGIGNLWDGLVNTTVTVPPLPSSQQTGYCTIPPSAPVQAVERPMFILSKTGTAGDAQAAPGEKAILYFHSGGYNQGHPLWMSLPFKLAHGTGLRVFSPNYRKTLSPETAYPAPLLDIVAANNYLLNLGFAQSNILVLGDSVGGHLTMALVTQLQATNSALPGALALCSPWVDLTFSFPSWEWRTDMLFSHKLKRAAESAMRHYKPEAARDVLFSPALTGKWKYLTDVPVFVAYGDKECLRDETVALVQAMEDDGVHVEVYAETNGVHIGPNIEWHGPEAGVQFVEGVNRLVEQMGK